MGITANSFNSVSLDPPLVLWSLRRDALSLPVYEAADFFIVNVLAADQIEVSNRFATQGKLDKFNGVKMRAGLGGAPVLADCAACFQCEKKLTYDGGDHVIFVGEVLEFDATDRPGLVFHQGQYAVSEPYSPNEALDDSEERLSIVEDYLDYLLSQAVDGFERQFQDILDEHGMGKFEWRLLCCVSEYPGADTGSLSMLSLIPEDEMRRVLDSMVEKAWLSESQDDEGAATFHVEKPGIDQLVPVLVAAGPMSGMS